MKLFPAIEEVFAHPDKIYKTLFFPLLTIDLSEMDKGEGLVHFVSVWGNGGASAYENVGKLVLSLCPEI